MATRPDDPAATERARAYLREHPPEPPPPPVIPPPPGPDLAPQRAAAVERRRLIGLGRLDEAGAWDSDSRTVYIDREDRPGFTVAIPDGSLSDLATAVVEALRLRIEHERAVEAERLAGLRRRARIVEDVMDRRRFRDRELDRLCGQHDRHLASAEKRWRRADGELFTAEEAT